MVDGAQFLTRAHGGSFTSPLRPTTVGSTPGNSTPSCFRTTLCPPPQPTKYWAANSHLPDSVRLDSDSLLILVGSWGLTSSSFHERVHAHAPTQTSSE